MINKKIIDINDIYYIQVTYHTKNTNILYVLKEKKEDKTIINSFNMYSFIEKAKKITKINNKIIYDIKNL